MKITRFCVEDPLKETKAQPSLLAAAKDAAESTRPDTPQKSRVNKMCEYGKSLELDHNHDQNSDDDWQ